MVGFIYLLFYPQPENKELRIKIISMHINPIYGIYMLVDILLLLFDTLNVTNLYKLRALKHTRSKI